MEEIEVIKTLERQKQKDLNTVKYMKNAFIIMKDNYSQVLEELDNLIKDRQEIHK